MPAQPSAVPEQATTRAETAVAHGHGTREPSLTGSGRIHDNYSPDDDIRFSFDAHGNSIGAKGTFSFSHEVDGVVYRAEGEVDCLVTGGDVATITGMVTSTDVPSFQDQRVGITVEDDGRRDRLGFTWSISPDPVPRCLGTASFAEVVEGGYVVKDGPFLVPGYPPPGSEDDAGSAAASRRPADGNGFGTYP